MMSHLTKTESALQAGLAVIHLGINNGECFGEPPVLMPPFQPASNGAIWAGRLDVIIGFPVPFAGLFSKCSSWAYGNAGATEFAPRLNVVAPERRSDFSRLALRAMVAGALACQLTACIVGGMGRF